MQHAGHTAACRSAGMVGCSTQTAALALSSPPVDTDGLSVQQAAFPPHSAAHCTVVVASHFDYDTANARLKRDVQLLLSAALSPGLVMRVCAPSVLCTGARHTASGSHQSRELATVNWSQ
jgi:hypothetical protein